jgi:hypothetical protein
MENRFYVVYWKKVGGFSNISMIEVDDNDRGFKQIKQLHKEGFDGLLCIESNCAKTGKKRYKIEKTGFYHHLKFFTEGIYFVIIFISIILYLYFKFKN